MQFANLLLSVALTMPRAASDATEIDADRQARLAVLAEAIEEASGLATCEDSRDPECVPTWRGSRTELSALLLAVAWHESAFSRRVHAGQCARWECDHGRARSPWQLHSSGLVPVVEWRAMNTDSPEATRIAAQAAARVLSRARGRCGSVEGALSAYATGGRCQWRGAKARLRTYRTLLARLEE